MKCRWIATAVGIIACLAAVGPADSADTPDEPDSAAIAVQIDGSLHNTTRGMGYFYEEVNGGFEKFTHIPYVDLACKGCHVTGADCRRCHPAGEAGYAKPPAENCLKGCHSRQAAEAAQDSDPHMTKHGLVCADCHHANDVHGDGKAHESMLDGAIAASCTQAGCHTDATAIHGANPIYNQHGEDFHCAACHTHNTISCVNCHFESEVDGAGEFANMEVYDWKFLMKYRKANDSVARVYPGNIQTITYHGLAFYVVAPFYGHSISKPESCQECHSSPAVKIYADSGFVPLLSWNEETGKMEHIAGVIPVPDDWAEAFRLDFVTRDSTGAWIFQQHNVSEEGTQMLYGEPLGKMPKM